MMEEEYDEEYSQEEMQAVVAFLRERANSLKNLHMRHEYGDNFAYANKKWEIIRTLKSEENGVRRTLNFAQDRLIEISEKAGEAKK